VADEVASTRVSSQAVEQANSPALEIQVVDRLDRKVSFTAFPKRVVSLTPSTTELLFAIGAGAQVVGATEYCNYPPEATRVPRVGAGTLESISRETILSLQPDLVLCKWDRHQPLIDPLERFGVQVIAVGPEALQELFDEAELLGRVLGHEQQARELIDSMTARRDKLAAMVQTVPIDNRRRIFYEVWDEPLMTAGPKSFIGEIIEIGGMQNIFADVSGRYPKVSSEVVVHRDPEVILAPTSHAEHISVESILGRQGWGNVRAIRDKQVYLIDGDSVSRCGPRLLDALEEMMRVVYPDLWPATTHPISGK
jgi:iron complex transport system substrate-binding protein